MWNLWKWFQLICVVKIFSVNSENLNFTRNLIQLANKISEDYFQVFRCVTYTADDAGYLDYLEFRLPVIIIILSTPENYLGQLLTESFEQGCGGHIIHTSPEKRLLLVRELIKAKSRAERYRYNNERYVFLPNGSTDIDMGVLRQPDLYFLPNSILVTPGSDSLEFFINGHTTFKANSREFYQVLDSWSSEDGYRNETDLFPDKLKDMEGKKMVFGLMPYTPYSLAVEEYEGVTFDGLDVRLADLFATVINGKWTAIDHPIHLWGTKLPNGSGNGVFGSVLSHAVDLGFGGFYQWYCDIIDCTYPYIQSQVTCLVPRPQILSGWMTILLPFTVSSWIGLSVAFLIALIFVFFFIAVDKHYNVPELKMSRVLPTAFLSVYMIFRLQFQQIPKVVNKTSPLATYIKISTMYYFFVAVFWQGGIASILTVPRYEMPISSPADLVSRWPKVEWGAVHGAWVNSIENSSDSVLKTIVEKFVVLDGESLKKKTKTRDFAFLIERMPNGHYGFNDYIDEEAVQFLRVMEHEIYTAFGTMILPRGSPYTEKLDNIIHWMYSTGIIQKMEFQVYLDRINNHLQSLIRHSNEREIVKVILGIRHIEGPIYIYFVGVFLSVVSFIGEKLSFKYKKQKKIS